jgi:hypothetical protein
MENPVMVEGVNRKERRGCLRPRRAQQPAKGILQERPAKRVEKAAVVQRDDRIAGTQPAESIPQPNVVVT